VIWVFAMRNDDLWDSGSISLHVSAETSGSSRVCGGIQGTWRGKSGLECGMGQGHRKHELHSTVRVVSRSRLCVAGQWQVGGRCPPVHGRDELDRLEHLSLERL